MPSHASATPDALLLSQQIREVHQSVIALSVVIKARTLQSEELQDSVQTEMSRLRQDHKDLEEKLDCVICVMQHDLESLRSSSLENSRSVDEMLRVVQELRGPVSEIVALRSRVAGLILGLGVLGSVAMWLAEPLYRWVVEHDFVK